MIVNEYLPEHKYVLLKMHTDGNPIYVGKYGLTQDPHLAEVFDLRTIKDLVKNRVGIQGCSILDFFYVQAKLSLSFELDKTESTQALIK